METGRAVATVVVLGVGGWVAWPYIKPLFNSILPGIKDFEITSYEWVENGTNVPVGTPIHLHENGTLRIYYQYTYKGEALDAELHFAAWINAYGDPHHEGGRGVNIPLLLDNTEKRTEFTGYADLSFGGSWLAEWNNGDNYGLYGKTMHITPELHTTYYPNCILYTKGGGAISDVQITTYPTSLTVGQHCSVIVQFYYIGPDTTIDVYAALWQPPGHNERADGTTAITVKNSLAGKTHSVSVLIMSQDLEEGKYGLYAKTMGIDSFSPYYPEVVTISGGGNGGTPPAAPSNLAANAPNANAVTLTWIDNSDNEVGFEIQRSLSPAFVSGFIKYSTFPNFSDIDGIMPNMTYYYRVRAYNNSGESSWSNTASATTPSDGGGGIPAAPSGLTAQQIATDTIRVSWTNNATGEVNFRVERATNSTFSGAIGIVAPPGYNWIDDSINILPNTSYWYRAQAYNDYGYSGYSNVTSITTGPPPAPGGIEFIPDIQIAGAMMYYVKLKHTASGLEYQGIVMVDESWVIEEAIQSGLYRIDVIVYGQNIAQKLCTTGYLSYNLNNNGMYQLVVTSSCSLLIIAI